MSASWRCASVRRTSDSFRCSSGCGPSWSSLSPAARRLTKSRRPAATPCASARVLKRRNVSPELLPQLRNADTPSSTAGVSGATTPTATVVSFGMSRMTAVTLKLRLTPSWEISSVRPVAWAAPKYFRAMLSVTATEDGADSAVARSPAASGYSSTSKKLGST